MVLLRTSLAAVTNAMDTGSRAKTTRALREAALYVVQSFEQPRSCYIADRILNVTKLLRRS